MRKWSVVLILTLVAAAIGVAWLEIGRSEPKLLPAPDFVSQRSDGRWVSHVDMFDIVAAEQQMLWERRIAIIVAASTFALGALAVFMVLRRSKSIRCPRCGGRRTKGFCANCGAQIKSASPANSRT